MRRRRCPHADDGIRDVRVCHEGGLDLARFQTGEARAIAKIGLANYFAEDLPARTRLMVAEAERVDWIVTDGEVDALMLEYTLVQKHQPRFNIKLRDDKSFPFILLREGHELRIL